MVPVSGMIGRMNPALDDHTRRPNVPVTAPRGPFDPEGVTWKSVSPKLARARLAGSAVVFGIPILAFLIVALAAEQSWAWFVVAPLALFLGWTMWLIPRQVRAIGYAERDNDLLIRKGIMFRELNVVPYGRMQMVDVEAGPIANLLGIASVKLQTASVGTDAEIPGLLADDAAALRDHLSALGESRMAGL